MASLNKQQQPFQLSFSQGAYALRPYILIFALSITDLFMTNGLLQADTGIVEGNPLMAFALNAGGLPYFIALKMALTAGGLSLLALCQPYQPSLIEKVLFFLTAVYVFIVLYEVILFIK